MSKDSKKNDVTPTPGELFSLSPIKTKPIAVSFTAPDLSSQGGLLLMREDEQRNGFISKLADCIEDSRSQSFVQHSYYEMIRQRICQIAAGYEDAEDRVYCSWRQSFLLSRINGLERRSIY